MMVKYNILTGLKLIFHGIRARRFGEGKKGLNIGYDEMFLYSSTIRNVS